MLNEKVWIIVPAYNEHKNIFGVIKSLQEHCQNIVVVNDASKDRTKDIVKPLGVYLINHMINRGQGAALQTGTEFALKKGAKIIVHFDADGQMQAKDIYRIIVPIVNKEADIVGVMRKLFKSCKGVEGDSNHERNWGPANFNITGTSYKDENEVLSGASSRRALTVEEWEALDVENV